MASSEVESAQDLEQRTLLVATEMALAAEGVKKEAQERASWEVELAAKRVRQAEEMATHGRAGVPGH